MVWSSTHWEATPRYCIFLSRKQGWQHTQCFRVSAKLQSVVCYSWHNIMLDPSA